MISAEQVKAATLAAGLKRIDHHDCGFCGVMVHYTIEDGELLLHTACDCVTYYEPPRHQTWESAAEWINMQNNEDARVRIAAKFGVVL